MIMLNLIASIRGMHCLLEGLGPKAVVAANQQSIVLHARERGDGKFGERIGAEDHQFEEAWHE